MIRAMEGREPSISEQYEKLTQLSDHSGVFLVQDKTTRTLCVQKELSRYNRSVYEFLMRQTASCFPRVYRIEERDGLLIVIEEYIPGTTLEQLLLERGTCSEEMVRWIALELCNALAILHAQSEPIIHRDLKPSNLMLSPEGRLCLIDFDTARRFDESGDRDTRVLGTRSFAAPEQFGFMQTDTRADIYALGVTLHVLLTGRLPGAAESESRLWPLIRRCVQFDPEKRFQSVGELEQAIRALDMHPAGNAEARGSFSTETGERQSAAGCAETDRSGTVADRCVPQGGQRKSSSGWRSFLPPGFRTGRLWRMIFAILGYLFIYAGGLTLQVNDALGQPMAGAQLMWNRLCFIVVGTALVMFLFNYGDVHRFLPLMRSGRLKRVIGYGIYSVLIVFVPICILVIAEQSLL